MANVYVPKSAWKELLEGALNISTTKSNAMLNPERGAGSAIMAGIACSIILCVLMVIGGLTWLYGRAQARSFADITAIQIADRTVNQGQSVKEACEKGRNSLRRQRAELVECRSQGEHIIITVRVPRSLLFPDIRAEAEAGPE